MLHQHLLTTELQSEVQTWPVCGEFTRETQSEQQGPCRQRSEGKQQMKSTAEWSGNHLGLTEMAELLVDGQLLWMNHRPTPV